MRKYALFGSSVSQSLSPIIHHLFAKQSKQTISYNAISVKSDELLMTLKNFQPTGHGANITIPFKEPLFSWVSQTTERATRAKAINTITFQTDGTTLGDNTDGIGLIRDLTQNQHFSLYDKSILILGAGGATRGILGPLLDMQPKNVTLMNRTVHKASMIVNEFANHKGLSYLTKLNNQQFDIVINSLPPTLVPPMLESQTLHPGTFYYDLSYQLPLTPFLTFVKNQGATHYTNGLGMLVEQAAEAFFVWHNIHPDTQPVIKALSIQTSI